jgi:hypothetical protein
MRTSLTDDDARDRGGATDTGLAPATVHLELILEAAGIALGRPVEGVETRPLALDGLAQRLADLGMEDRRPRGADTVRPRQRVQARSEERFVRVDVADAGDKFLVEEQRLERPTMITSALPWTSRILSSHCTCSGVPWSGSLFFR